VVNLLNYSRAVARASAHDRVAFNVTGGFKGAIPYLTLLGMF
jgi:hypothetical protein